MRNLNNVAFSLPNKNNMNKNSPPVARGRTVAACAAVNNNFQVDIEKEEIKSVPDWIKR